MQNKSITKNTAYLTVRMIFLMVISFYTSRVILDKLGIEDYGIYNIVSSIAIAFSFFSSSLTNATQRFVTIELGRCNLKKANQLINLHFEVYTIITIICFLVAEILGVYTIQYKITIPPERIDAAIWVFQFALIMVSCQLLSIPFEACVIAHEDMNIYSYMGVFEGIMRLAISFAVTYVSSDKLIFYSILMCLVTVFVQSGYTLYAFKNYSECFIKFYWNLNYLKESFSFVSWNIVGTARVAVITQGMDLVLNFFLGPVANAARGITNQVSGVIFKFSSNILVAAQPQLVKSYANGNKERLNSLLFKTSLFSFYVLWILIAPMLFNLNTILNIWLKEVPQWTAGFLFWHLCTSFIYVLTKPLWSIIVAVGKLQRYVILDTITSVLGVPIAVIVLKFGFTPEYVYIALFLVQMLNTGSLLCVVNKYVEFGLKTYFLKVITKIIIISAITSPVSWSFSILFDKSLIGFAISYSLGLLLVSLIILFIGVDEVDRTMIWTKLKQKLL